MLVVGAQDGAGLDVALGVVVVVAGGGVDAAHRADHFAGKQHVLHRDHGVEQVDARLVVHAGVKEHVVQQVLVSSGFFISCARPGSGPSGKRHRAAAVRDQELERGEVLEQIALDELHEGRGVGIEVVRAGGVEARVAAGAHVDHGGHVVLHHLFVDGVPVLVGQRGLVQWPPGVGVQVDADGAVFLHALFQLGGCRWRDRRRATAAAWPRARKWSGNSVETR